MPALVGVGRLGADMALEWCLEETRVAIAEPARRNECPAPLADCSRSNETVTKGTNPLASDTDRDGVRDSSDLDPLRTSSWPSW